MTAGKQIVAAAPAQIITPKVARYADRIARAWTAGVTAIIETGKLLDKAKADCAHGEWQMLIDELPFGDRHAHRLRALAAYMPFRTHESDLPSDTETLYQLSRLPAARFEKLLEDEVIHPAMPRKDASAETRAERLAADQARVAKLKPVNGRVRTLVLDPPWEEEHLSASAKTNTPYATLTLDEIAALPVPDWAMTHSHCYLWFTNNRVAVVGDVMKGWGFAPKSLLTWNKKTKDGSRPRNGRGHYFLNDTEQVLFGVKGKMGTRVSDIRTGFDGPVAGHSVKPGEFYDIVRRASPGPYGEAFQRKPRQDFKNLFEGTDPSAAGLRRAGDG